MRDANPAFERVGEHNRWIVGWVSCGVGTSVAVFMIFLDWAQRALVGKVAAVSFLAFLFIFPVTVLVRLKKGKQVTPGWVFSLGYILLFLALQAFGPLAHSH